MRARARRSTALPAYLTSLTIYLVSPSRVFTRTERGSFAPANDEYIVRLLREPSRVRNNALSRLPKGIGFRVLHDPGSGTGIDDSYWKGALAGVRRGSARRVWVSTPSPWRTDDVEKRVCIATVVSPD